MTTFLIIHLVGAGVAIFLQMILVNIVNQKLRSTYQVYDYAANVANRHDLIIDMYSVSITSKRLQKSIGISGAIKRSRLIDFGTIVQSLILGWLNVLIVGFMLIVAIGKPAPSVSSNELGQTQAELDGLNDPECTTETIIDTLTALLLTGNESFHDKVEFRAFLLDHFEHSQAHHWWNNVDKIHIPQWVWDSLKADPPKDSIDNL